MITFRGTKWTDTVEAHLSKMRNINVSLGWFKSEIEAGRAHALLVEVKGEPVGCFVYRIEEAETGFELAILAAGGAAKGVNLVKTVLPQVEKLAAAKGCKSVRFHTARGGLEIQAAELGYSMTEIVMRKEV